MSGIYIHIPFCKQACHYCDFHFSTSMKKKDAMVSALKKELELRKNEFEHTIVETIYFGGGTPSVLNSEEINRIIETVYTHYQVAENPEITLEANPDDLTDVSLSAVEDLEGSIFHNYLNIGINRLSIGVQSFFEEDLHLMNRAHNAKEAEECITKASQYFENISIDLIYGIPGMSHLRWRQNIEKALSFGIAHISAYALTVEPKTALAHMIKKGQIADVNDESAERQFYLLLDILEHKGFVNYEISNFGKAGFFSKNNMAYWQDKKYIGIGPSAHSFDGAKRGWNINNNPKYIKALEHNELPIEFEKLTIRDRYNEYVMTGLRTVWGISLHKVASAFGDNYVKHLKSEIKRPIDQGLLILNEDILKVTKKGKFLADGIASGLFMLNLD